MRVAIIPALLSGCALVATGTFDPVEYDRWIGVTSSAQVISTLCPKPDQASLGAENLLSVVEYALLYSSTKIKSDRVTTAGAVVQGLARDLNTRYKTDKHPTTAYCQLKLKEIEIASKTIAASLAKKEM
jgi:hypothetical protein